MRIKGTKKAFEQMIKQRGIYNQLGVSRQAVNNWRRGQPITIDTMEALLKKAGYKIVSETIWEV